MDLAFYIGDFLSAESSIDNSTLVYADPPYLITLGSYNDGKRGFNGWNETDETKLLQFFDNVIQKGAKVVISNILTYKGKTNHLLINWLKKYHHQIIDIPVRKRNEQLIIIDPKTTEL